MSERPTKNASASAPAPSSSDLEDVLSRPGMHERDRVPRWMMRAQGLIVGVVSYDSRQRFAVLLVLAAIAVAMVLASTRVLNFVFDGTDTIALIGLFIVNWIGNGGILVPIPGARFIGLLMIFQHTVFVPSLEVLAVAGAAMGLGLVSYYIAGARSADAYSQGDGEGAEDVDDPTILAGVDESAMPATEPAPSSTATPVHAPDPVEQLVDDRAAVADESASTTRRRLTRRFSDSWQKAQARAQPAIEKHGLSGMFWLCLVPSPAATAAAFLGGAMRFGFTRFLLATFASKYLLAGIFVVAGLVFSQQAQSIQLPF